MTTLKAREIVALIATGESETLELKRSTAESETLELKHSTGESETLKLKRSTAELKRAGEMLCAFLNGNGGEVLIGVAPDGQLVGQDVADITLRDTAVIVTHYLNNTQFQDLAFQLLVRRIYDEIRGSKREAAGE